MGDKDYRKQIAHALEIAESVEVSKGRKDGLAEILREYDDRIKGLLKKGHSRGAVAGLLADNGVAASKETIRAYINKLVPRIKTTKKVTPPRVKHGKTDTGKTGKKFDSVDDKIGDDTSSQPALKIDKPKVAASKATIDADPSQL